MVQAKMWGVFKSSAASRCLLSWILFTVKDEIHVDIIGELGKVATILKHI